MCGSGVGTFIFAPLTSALLETYGWRGANLIFAALCLQCMVRKSVHCTTKFYNFAMLINKYNFHSDVQYFCSLPLVLYATMIYITSSVCGMGNFLCFTREKKIALKIRVFIANYQCFLKIFFYP